METHDITKTFTTMLCPESERVASYLWLTHRLFNHQIRLVVDEYLHLRRAAEIARYGGDVDKAVAHLRGVEGKKRIKRHFSEFVQRFIDGYGLSRQDAVDVALRTGEMSDYFLVAPDGEDGKPRWKVPQNMHGFFQRLTKTTSTGFENVHPKDKPDYITEWLYDFQRRGIVQFDRNKVLALGWSEKLYNIAAHHLRSHGAIQKNREKEREDWEAKRDEFKEQHKEFFEHRYRLFEAYEMERTEESKRLLAESQPDRQVKHTIRIRGHMVKGLGKVLKEWEAEKLWRPKEPVADDDAGGRTVRRKEVFQQLREEDKEAFGDHRFFEWLSEHADDGAEFADDFKVLLDYNFKYLDDRKPKAIGFSKPSFDKHPLWYELEESFSHWPGIKYYVCDPAKRTLLMRLVVPGADTKKEGNKLAWDENSVSRPALSDAEIQSCLDNPSNVEVVPVPVKFKPDSRILNYVSVNEDKSRPDKFDYLFEDKLLKERVPFRFGGLKLVFRPRPVARGKSKPYAYFSAQVQMPFARPRRVKNAAKEIDPGTRVLAVDLGCRHRAFGVVLEYDGQNGDTSQVWAGPIKVPGGRHLAHVDKHEDDHRRSRSKAQKDETGVQRSLPRGVPFDADFREHIVNMKDDLNKQSAHAIIETALEHDAKIIVMEMLEGYRPTTDRTRRENRRLRTSTFRGLYHELTSSKSAGGNFIGVDRAGAYGIAVYSYPAAFTSKVCHKCGWPGVRFSEVRQAWFKSREGDPITHRRFRGLVITYQEAGQVLIQQGGSLFCCSNPDCSVVKINADYNAAHNLHRKFRREDLVKSKGRDRKKVYVHPSLGAVSPREFWGQAEEDARAKLTTRGFTLAGAPDEKRRPR